MYSVSSGDVSYIVPMDYVDLKFLRRHEQIGDNLKPLWSPRQEEYTEFQLNAWRKTPNDEDQQDKNENITTMCHICDTQVPVLYLKDHYNSKKHKNIMKIIDEALSRLRSNVNIDFPAVSTKEPSKSTYFCEACCISVLTNNKETHEASTIHKKSTNDNKIIENLLMAFVKDSTTKSNDVKDDSMDGNNNSVPKNEDSKASSSIDQLKVYIDAVTNKITPDTIEITVLDENHIVMKRKSNCLRVHTHNFNGFVNNDQGVNCLLCNAVVKSKSDHMWTGQHKRWMIWHLPDEHCIRQINQYYSHCIICNELIRNVEEHKAASNHTNKLKNALYNTLNSATCHQTRTLKRNTEKTTATQLDNGNIEENHPKPNEKKIEIQTDNTETKYVHYLICRTDLSRKGAVCTLCDCVIPDFKTNIEDHLNGRTHKKNYNDFLSKNHMSKVQNGFACGFCRFYVADMTEIKHASSYYHERRMKGEVIYTTDQTYCEPCRVYIDTHNFVHHRNGKKHKQNAFQQTTAKDIGKSNLVDINKTYAMATSNLAQDASLRKSLGTEHEKETIRHTSAPNLNVKNIQPSSINNIQSTVSEKSKKGQTTNEAIQLSTPTMNIKLANPEIKNIQPKTKIVQPVNNINKPSNLGINKDKTSEVKDIQTLMSALDINSSTTDKKTSDVKNIETSSSQTKAELKVNLNYQMKETSNSKELLCKVCKKTVPNTTDNITSHINGNNHKTNYKNLLNLNNVVQVETNFHCNKCNVPITNKNEIDHILGNRHKITISNNHRSSTVSDNISDDLNSNKNQKPSRTEKFNEYKAKLYLFDESFNSQYISCRICHTIVRKCMDEVINHANDVSHLDKYNGFLKNYKIAKLKNKKGFICKVCDEIFASQNELSHIFSSEHQFRLLDSLEDGDFSSGMSSSSSLSLSYETYCGFCHIYVSVKEYSIHRISDGHIDIVKNISKGAFFIYFNKITDKSILKCRLCDCTVNNEYKCAIEHLEGSAHKTAYNKMLDMNKICSVGDKMYCLVCKEILTSGEELIHLWEPNHSGNLSFMK